MFHNKKQMASPSALEGAKMLKCLRQKLTKSALVLGISAFCAIWAGCASQQAPSSSPPITTNAGAASISNTPSMLLHEGNTVKISFPGAPTLDTTQIVRQDGKITLEMVGEMKVTGLTPPELEKELLKVYGSQLVDKEVTVTVLGAVFEVYVTGSVLKPGKITSDRVETPLEAIIEAGLDHNKANLKKVVVVREAENGQTEKFVLNLDDVLKGRSTKPFILKPLDKIYVPEKFTWY
jgi:polysaccharide export outer membrane protein